MLRNFNTTFPFIKSEYTHFCICGISLHQPSGSAYAASDVYIRIVIDKIYIEYINLSSIYSL